MSIGKEAEEDIKKQFITNLFNGKEVTMGDFDLAGYKPEAPTDGGFDTFKYDGPVKINKAIVSVNDSVDSEFYPSGCNQIEIEAEVLNGEYAGRKLWKRFNLDSTKAEGKKPKTPVQKLADQLFAVGLEFNGIEQLREATEKLVTMVITVKAWGAKFGERNQQMWNMKGVAPEKWDEEVTEGKKKVEF